MFRLKLFILSFHGLDLGRLCRLAQDQVHPEIEDGPMQRALALIVRLLRDGHRVRVLLHVLLERVDWPRRRAEFLGNRFDRLAGCQEGKNILLLRVGQPHLRLPPIRPALGSSITATSWLDSAFDAVERLAIIDLL